MEGSSATVALGVEYSSGFVTTVDVSHNMEEISRVLGMVKVHIDGSLVSRPL